MYAFMAAPFGKSCKQVVRGLSPKAREGDCSTSEEGAAFVSFECDSLYAETTRKTDSGRFAGQVEYQNNSCQVGLLFREISALFSSFCDHDEALIRTTLCRACRWTV